MLGPAFPLRLGNPLPRFRAESAFRAAARSTLARRGRGRRGSPASELGLKFLNLLVDFVFL